MAVRNPFLGIFATLGWAAVLAPLLYVPDLLMPLLGLPSEVPLFYGVAAFAIAGAVAGRSGTFAWAALPAAFIGALAGYATVAAVAALPVNLLYAAIHAAVAGAGAWARATSFMAKVTPEIHIENEEKRRCRMCGARVGPRATRCWSCRASLHRIT